MNPWLQATNLLVIRLDNGGDVLMLGPALQAIKRHAPGAKITLLASPAGSAVADLLPDIDEVIVWRSVWQDLGSLPFDPDRERRFIYELRARTFNAAVIFTSFSQTPHAAGYLCYLAGIPLRAGESREFGGAVLSTELRGAPDEMHQVERNLRLIESLGFPTEHRPLLVTISDIARVKARQLLHDVGIVENQPYVLIHPGASARARRYPADRWGVVARLLGERGWPVLLTGVENEREAVTQTAAFAPRAIPLIGQTSIAEYAALVEGASLVLCGNTLPMHLADATRTPVVVLYSGTDLEQQWAPRSTAARLLRVPTACHPCYCFDCPIGLPCLDIAPEQVVAAGEALLAAMPVDCHGIAHPREPKGDNPLQTADQELAPDVSVARIGAPTDTMPPTRQSNPIDAASETSHSSGVLPLDSDLDQVVVVQALGLGDFLCTTPALCALRRRFPAATITFVGSPWAEEAIRRSALVDQYLPFPGWPGIAEWPPNREHLAAFFTALQSTRIDLAIQMHGSGTVSNGFIAALDPAYSLGYRTDTKPDNRLTSSLVWIEKEPEQLRWLRLVASLGAIDAPTRPEFPLVPGETQRARDLVAPVRIEGAPLVAIHVGAKDPARRWSPERFAAVAQQLGNEVGARILLTGSRTDAALTSAVAAAAPTTPLLDLAGETDLGILAALLAQCDLLISNDTGVSHLAAAMATPSVVLFGPAKPERWAPLDTTRHRAIDARAVVGGSDGAMALASLPIEPVISAALEQLRRFALVRRAVAPDANTAVPR